VNLEESITNLPWVVEGQIMELGDSSITAVAENVYLGDFSEGDTLRIRSWDMGSLITQSLSEGGSYLLIPDESGRLQIAGFPGEGCWILRGYYDFNAFMTEPGVISPQELRMICRGDSIPDRTVLAEIWFAGASEYLQVLLKQTGDGWISSSEFGPMDSLMLDSWDFSLGGVDTAPFESEVHFIVTAGSGGLQKFQGMVRSHAMGIYRCVIYPTGPMILSSRELEDYLATGESPPSISIPLSIDIDDPSELGLAQEPEFTFGESGLLHLSGEEGPLDITSIYYTEAVSRPIVGFDQPMTCSDPLYLRFDGLAAERSGHLGTDIINAMAKGMVGGMMGFDPEDLAIEFTLAGVVSD